MFKCVFKKEKINKQPIKKVYVVGDIIFIERNDGMFFPFKLTNSNFEIFFIGERVMINDS